MRYLLVTFALVSCARGGLPDSVGDAGGDGQMVHGDGRQAIDSAPPAPGTQLLLSEIALAPAGSEFIEVFNPMTQAIDLSHYYLSDSDQYYKLPAATPSLTTGDFIVQFPAGASVPARSVVTVAVGTAAAFNSAFGKMPSYSVADATVTRTATSGTPSLTDSGEVIVLFSWDGSAPLVKDVDIMIAGVPTTGNTLTSKSNYVQGSGTYKSDAMTIGPQAGAPTSGTSTKRIKPEPGHETQNGTGNGITGDDETSEQTGTTWDTTFGAPTPGNVPSTL